MKKMRGSIAKRPIQQFGFSFGEDGSCPTSDHRKKQHRGICVRRETVRKQLPMWRGNGATFVSVSYRDHMHCKFCDATGVVEWMPA